MPPTPSELTTSELAVLESLQDAKSSISQRELARRSGLSVGLVNAIIKRLIHTGYVKTSRLNRRSIEYLLTPDGFSQTAVRSYRYVVDTVRKYKKIQNKLGEIVAALQAEGFTEFYLHGDGDLAELVAMLFKDGELGHLHRGILPRELLKSPKMAVLNTDPKSMKTNGLKTVDLVGEFHNGGDGPRRRVKRR